jgi:hypothetical protein
MQTFRTQSAPIAARVVAHALGGMLVVSSPAALFATSLFATTLVAQSPFAAQVVASNTNGGAGGGIFNPANALGAPGGASSVHSLGIAGDLTLAFAPPIVDRPGADLIVGENPFRLSNWWQSFAEVAFVEVSTNGVDFLRFPARYFGAPVQPGAFGTVPVGAYGNLTGQTPVLATTPGTDPFDVVDAGGDAFDLGDLANEPLVLMGLVDLQAIGYVRLVDVVSGTSLDSVGTAIFDAGSGSADIDSVTAIHQQGAITGSPPLVDLVIHVDGTMTLRVEDPDGWQDLDPQSLRGALFGIPVDAGGLLASFQMTAADATGFTLTQPVPLPPGLLFTLSLSLKDFAGNRSGQARPRPTF